MADAGNSRDYKILRRITFETDRAMKFPEVLPDDDHHQVELKKLFAKYYYAYVAQKDDYYRMHNHCARIIIWINNYRIKNWYFKPITNVKWE